MRFMSQASELTLKEGLDELYTSAPEVAAVSARKGKHFGIMTSRTLYSVVTRR